MKIIVTGSLGNISRPLTEELVRKGHNVTVISSKKDNRSNIEQLGAKAAIGQLEDAAFLTTTFKGADAAYCMVPPNYENVSDPVEYYEKVGNSYIQAIKQSGVKRIVQLSSYGAHLDKGTGPILGTHLFETLLEQVSNAAITNLRPAYFYNNLFSFVGLIKQANMMAANYGGDKIQMVSPVDIAAVVAEEIVSAEAKQKVRYVMSDARTGSEIAAVLGRAIGKPELQWHVITDEQMLQGMIGSGMPKPTAESFVEMFSSLREGRLSEDLNNHKPKELGKVKLEDFAKEFAGVYSHS